MSRTNAVLNGKRCKCAACHEVFSTTSNFDRHRKGRHGVDRHCVNPDDVGLRIKAGSTGSYWCMPGASE